MPDMPETTSKLLTDEELETLTEGNQLTGIPSVVNPLYPIEHKIMIGQVEGGAKTWILNASAIHVASGKPFLGMDVIQSPVIILDEETPKATLMKRLDRFAQGLGIKTWQDLPIVIRSKVGFRFSNTDAISGVKTAAKELIHKYPESENLFITMDSHISMLGGDVNENNDSVGRTLGNALDEIQRYCRDELLVNATTLMAAHAKKQVVFSDVEDLSQGEMQTMVRGHGSIVGLGCDTGYMVKKISSNPLRGVLIPKTRREALVLNGKELGNIYWELQEESYGQGKVRMVRIDPVPVPPSELAITLFSLFFNNKKGKFSSHDLSREMALYEPEGRRLAVRQLERHKIIINKPETPFTFRFNAHYLDQKTQSTMSYNYAQQLSEAYHRVKNI